MKLDTAGLLEYCRTGVLESGILLESIEINQTKRQKKFSS
jgi:hypothetical protein